MHRLKTRPLKLIDAQVALIVNLFLFFFLFAVLLLLLNDNNSHKIATTVIIKKKILMIFDMCSDKTCRQKRITEDRGGGKRGDRE